MLAVHFGAGNIGRGFIGQLLHNAGYEVCFIDVNGEVINELNKKRAYTVMLADDTQQKVEVNNVRGINSMEDPQSVVKAIAQADIVTTAVGATILPRIAKLIADGLIERMKYKDSPLNIIACENMIEGSTYLKEEVYVYLAPSQKEKIEKSVNFPDAAVDRIVPIQSHEDKLLVVVEPFYEWVIDKSKIKGEIPAIDGVIYVDNLFPYIERKLFTVNTGHAATAYLGNYYGLSTIKDAITNRKIREIVENLLNETGELLVRKYGFDGNEHENYIRKIIDRFENEHISDEVTRVARSPIRKLGANDRFIKPARELIEFGITPEYLAIGIAAALLYENNEDEEVMELQNFLKHRSLEELLIEYSELSEIKELRDLIISTYEELIVAI